MSILVYLAASVGLESGHLDSQMSGLALKCLNNLLHKVRIPMTLIGSISNIWELGMASTPDRPNPDLREYSPRTCPAPSSSSDS